MKRLKETCEIPNSKGQPPKFQRLEGVNVIDC